MEIEPAENGGHTVTHHWKPMQREGKHGIQETYVEPESHVFGAGEGKKMMAHISDHLGIKAGKESKEEPEMEEEEA